MLATRKAQELEVVELLEDLPEHGLKRGERGAVVVAFDEPEEAYDLEFVDESGQSRFAYGVKPEQIKSTDEIAKEMFERGLSFLNEKNPSDAESAFREAENAFREAIALKPFYIAGLHNLIVERFKITKNWKGSILALRLVLRLNPNYEENGNKLEFFAKDNLATAYQNYGIQKAHEGNRQNALMYFSMALGVGPRDDIVSLIKRNIVRSYTELGIEAYQKGNFELSVEWMRHACEVELNAETRHNLGVAWIHLAEYFLNKQDLESATVALDYARDTGLVLPLLSDNLEIKAEFLPASPLQELQMAA